MENKHNVQIIRELIKLSKLSKKDFAEKAGINFSSLGSILSERRPCGNKIYRRVIEAFPEYANIYEDTPAAGTINTRLASVLRWTKKNIAEFARSIGTNGTTTTNYIRNGREPKRDFIEKIIARYPEISETWLYTGAGAMLVQEGHIDNDPQTPAAEATDICGRIKDYIELNKISQRQFGKAIDIPESTLRGYLDDKTTIPATVIIKILDVYKDISAEWLLRGLSAEEQIREIKQAQDEQSSTIEVMQRLILDIAKDIKIIKERISMNELRGAK